jgi:hypothetical protein
MKKREKNNNREGATPNIKNMFGSPISTTHPQPQHTEKKEEERGREEREE